ncbi:hypothetical protein ACFY2R_29360 [Micromonospora olivasterospora]|uniref:DUF7489 domain-containing protein n=1 Tax=Micromonospora olivasterospora TaxID=1880 RepID=A0A562IJM0_MICOL|nr:hypothetical protein [Micromonospora olivasterospora]TWH71026.1 hypothetical protein JD77_06051 [Micromonospora olivasterospora]
MTTDAWDGIVLKKSRGLLDGSSLYRRLKIRLADGSTITVRVGRDLWNAVTEGDRVTKAAGQGPRLVERR